MLELKNIKKSYNGTQQVLKGINIKFRKNEFVAILGPSGCGKTTLLNIIGGLDKCDVGEMIVDGLSTINYSDRDFDSYRNHRIGFIFQNYNLIMHQSVLSNVEINASLSGVSKKERRIRACDLLTKVGLEDCINKKPNQLSGGQMQRVAIARALVNNPDIILADEPTGALDFNNSVEIMKLLKKNACNKLVIVVTHNSDIANEYANRIIELRDGIITRDTNPYNSTTEENSSFKLKKTSISFLSSLSLSFNNLLTKKWRTFLTAFAGSIGIALIALIISLSNGVKNYTEKLEYESLNDYPLVFEKNSYDLFGSLASVFDDTESKTEECPINMICSTDDIIKNSVFSNEKGLIKKNNLKELKKYIDTNDLFKEAASLITYNYDIDLQLFTNNYNKVNPLEFKNENPIFLKLSVAEEKYELVAGKMAENYDEMVLVIPKSGRIKDSVLYSLGIKNRDNIISEIERINNDKNYHLESSNYFYTDIINRTYKLILNTDYYREENGNFIDYSEDKEYMKSKIDDGLDIKIVGILKSDNVTDAYLGYKDELITYLIEEISKTTIYKKQILNKKVNVLTNTKFDEITNSYEQMASKLGIYELDDPTSISVYPKNYESKQQIIKLIKEYNDEKRLNNETELVINYTDLINSLTDGITKIVSVISYILIGFVAISLIVSSIMISIITYISVLERTKEIGILRALGASKKDIKIVFIAETFVEGFISGILGIIMTLILSYLINLITNNFVDIDKIAVLPFLSAVLLILLSVILNVIAGLIPSLIAARKDPVEALRTE